MTLIATPLRNPFVPGSPAGADLFAGRIEELKIFEQCLLQAANGQSTHFIFQGERGIGKTALTLLLRDIAEGNVESPISKQHYDFNCVYLQLQKCKSEEQIIIRILRAMKEQIPKLQSTEQMKKWGGYLSLSVVIYIGTDFWPG